MSRAFSFPDGFLWGAATAAHQVEGHNRLNDWWAGEQAGRLPVASGEACRHYERYAEDFDLAASLGHNAHRLALEWSRIEPEPGRFDEAALAHYQDVILALRARGIEPVVTLHHFTNPLWLAERGGWLEGEVVEVFGRYAARVAAALGDQVRWWLTVNEPTVITKHAYVTGDWPPFVKGDWRASFTALRHYCRGHVAAREALKAARPDAMVGFAHSAVHVMPWEPGRLLDRAAAFARDQGLNRLMLYAMGWPARRPFDFIGLNYYTRIVVRWRPKGRALLLGEDAPGEDPGRPRRWSDMGWEIWPEGLVAELKRFGRLGVPLMITENGLATTDEAARLDYLVDHLAALGEAVAAGVPLAGYLHWSLIDNFEWALGFAPRFGLIEVDYATQARRVRSTALAYALVCRTNRLDEAAMRHAAGAGP
jgi:beta-glucosidase